MHGVKTAAGRAIDYSSEEFCATTAAEKIAVQRPRGRGEPCLVAYAAKVLHQDPIMLDLRYSVQCQVAKSPDDTSVEHCNI